MIANLLEGSLSSIIAAWSTICKYSIDIAHYYKRLRGQLKTAGSEIFEMSLPIESLIMDHRFNLVFGSLSQGSCSLYNGSPL